MFFHSTASERTPCIHTSDPNDHCTISYGSSFIQGGVRMGVKELSGPCVNDSHNMTRPIYNRPASAVYPPPQAERENRCCFFNFNYAFLSFLNQYVWKAVFIYFNELCNREVPIIMTYATFGVHPEQYPASAVKKRMMWPRVRNTRSLHE